jgi:hypothetical protein
MPRKDPEAWRLSRQPEPCRKIEESSRPKRSLEGEEHRREKGKAPAREKPVVCMRWDTGPQLFLPLLVEASPSCCVYGPEMTLYPSTPARLALENLPPSAHFRFHLIHAMQVWFQEFHAFLQLNGNNWM